LTPLEAFVSINSNGLDLKPIQTSLKSLYLLQNVLNDVVDFALINSNQLFLNFEEMNVFDFLRETLDIFSFQAEMKEMDLSYR
jgi:signal transduction histidine kinase